MILPDPSRGEIWLLDLDPTRGHEQSGRRPCAVISVDPFNHGPAGLVIIVPITTRLRAIASYVEVNPPEGGLTARSFIKCEEIRSASKERFVERSGAISASTLTRVEDRLRILLGL